MAEKYTAGACGLPAARLSGKPKQKDSENGKALKIRGLRGSKRIYRNFVAVLEHPGNPAPLNYRRLDIFSAACPGRGRPFLALFAALSSSLPAVFAAVTVVVLVSLFPATVEGQGDPEPCSGDGLYNPTPTAIEIGAVPIVVESTTADYFVLYVTHDVDGTEMKIPVLVKKGAAGTTTLAENVEALPVGRYRVEQYLITDPADVDGDCIDDLTELDDLGSMNPVNPAAAIEISDGAVVLPDTHTYDVLAGQGRFLKFALLGMDTDRPSVYFINAKTHDFHDFFLDAIGLDYEQNVYFGEIAYDPIRVAPDGSQGVYRYSINSLPSLSFSLMERTHTLLAASMLLLEDNLSLHVRNRELPQIQSDLPLLRESRINLVFDEDVYFNLNFLALNPGEGYGLLQVLKPDDRPHPRNIVIYEALPNELPRVAGIISTVLQTPLSHVNLRAIQDGIPNTFIRDALDYPSITTLIDSYVHYTVTEEGWDLRPATRAEIDAHYESSRPAGPQTPERDLSVTAITPLSEIGFADWKAFGVKAANVAVLGTLDFPVGTVPDGFAIPFYFYDEFMKDNGFYDRIEQMLADPDFQTDFETQDDMLDDLRDDIEDADSPQWIVDALTAMHATYPEGQSLRYRSSTNNEDLPGFNGAGLYDSKTQDPDETVEDGIDKSLKGVFASLWTFRAFTEREFHRIDHMATKMGVLVHPNYQDELVNGVAVSFDPFYDRPDRHYVNSQIGEDLVTNPEAHSLPEELLLHNFGTYRILATSNQVPPGQLLMSNNQLRQLRAHLEVIHDHFAGLYNPGPGEPFAMEIEFKITSDNILAIKQGRPWVFSAASQTTPPPPPPPPPRLPGGSGGGGPRQTVPDAPMNLVAEATDAAVTLTWDAPEDDGGSAVTDYEYRINGQGSWISIGSTDTTYTVTGLDNDTVYTFQVRAVNRIGRSQPSSDPVAATPRMPVALDFAHFANGEGITSDLVLVNAGTAPIQPTLYFYGQEGHLIDPESVVDVTGDLMVTEDGSLSVRTAMEPLGELTISTHGRGEVVSGSVKAVSNGPMGGVLRFGLPGIGVAGVRASLPLTDALFPVRRGGTLSTAAAIRNLSESELVVACRLMQEGMVLEEMEMPLAASGQEARFIEEMFTFINANVSDFVGSVRCTALPGEGMFTGVAVELDAENRIFTTLPVVPVDPSVGGGRETVLDFAHFANGDGVTSELVLVNRSTQPSRPAPTHFHSDILPNLPVLYFYDQGGDLIDPASVVDITGDLVVAEDSSLTVQTEMEPLGVLTISTHGRGDLLSGSVKVTSDRPLGGVLRFDLPGIGVVAVGASLPVRDAIFPARRQAGGISTAAAIHNLGAEATEVSCQLMKEGAVLEEVEIPLAANGQESQYIEEMFTLTDTSDFVGSVRCTALAAGKGMLTGVAVELDEGNRIVATLPVVPVER